MRKNVIIILLLGALATSAVVGFLEKAGRVEWIDDDFKEIVVQVPCVDTATHVVVKDSFRIKDSIRWTVNDSTIFNFHDSIIAVYKTVFGDSTIIDSTITTIPVDTGTTIHITADSFTIKGIGAVDYAIMSGGPVYNFSYRYRGEVPGTYTITPKQWTLGAAAGIGQFDQERNWIYQVNAGYKNFHLYLQSDMSVNHGLLIGYNRKF